MKHSQRFLFASILFLFSVSISLAQNKFNSRLFYVKPSLFNSKSKVTSLNLSRFDVKVDSPVDNRNKYNGELVYKKIKIHPMDEFFKTSTMNEIHNKINSDLKMFKAGQARNVHHDKVGIETTVEVFYPKVSGFINGKSFAKVRLAIDATLNDTLLISNKYESFYITDGTDKEFEGNVIMTIEEGTNVTVGMALRKTLDQFYADLKEAISRKDKLIVISGKVTNSKTDAGLSALISFKSDTTFSTTSSSDGKFRIVIPSAKNYNVRVEASDFITISDRLDIASSKLRVSEKDFKLLPIEKGTIINLKNVLFYVGTTNLLEESFHELDGVVAFLKAHPKIKIELRGHTDNQGDAKKDLVLSQQRVDKVRAYLVSKGINGRRVVGKGFGGAQPIATNDTEDGRKLNRRVEFVIVKN